MARSSVRRTLLILGSAIVGPLAATSGAANQMQERRPEAVLVRVRSSTTLLLDVIRDGHARSPTFRRLAARLEREAALVYVEPGRCRPTDPKRGGNQTISGCTDVDVGHELQHAVEVMEAAVSRQEDAARLGTEVRPGVYETEEAQRVSRAILAELSGTARPNLERNARLEPVD